MDAFINNDTTIDNSFTSVSKDATARAKFLEYGYYSMSNIVYQIQLDSSSPPKALLANYKNDLEVIFLNTNACYNRNFGNMLEMSDSGG